MPKLGQAIPQFKDTADPFWVEAARVLFANGAEAMLKAGKNSNGALLEMLLKTDLRAGWKAR